MFITITIFYSTKQIVIIGSFLVFLISFTIISVLIYWDMKFQSMNKGLHYRDELFNTLGTNIDDVFAIYQVETQKYEYISPNLEKILGLTKKAAEKDPFCLLNYTNIPGKDEIHTYFQNTTLRNNYEFECEMLHPITHQKRWIILRAYPVISQNVVIRYIFSATDVTKAKKTQQVLKDALLSAQKANEAKKEFLSHMSHELRTPINSIIGMAKVASNSIDDKDKIESCLDKITYSSQNLLSLINNILDMSRIDSDKLLLSKEPFYLNKLLYTLTSLIKSQAELKHQEFHLILGYQNDNLVGDSLRLNQILENCLSNSLKFTQNNGKIELEVNEIEQYGNKSLFRFIITDNGKGMSEEYLERIFIPFEQENPTIARNYGGSGLGLSITKNLVTLMGGNIRVSSHLGIGTIVTIDIVFEVRQQKTGQIETISKETQSENTEANDISGHRILVVEDNIINMEITCEFLKYADLFVETASNGKEALQMFEQSEAGYYDVILMDVQMPEMNGFQTTKEIRKSSHPDAERIYIIAMTANVYQEDIMSMLDCGMNYHIPKPINLENFYKILRRAIKEGK